MAKRGVLVVLLMLVAACTSAHADELVDARIEAILKGTREAGKIQADSHECAYHEIACGQTVQDLVNIFGCATDSGGYFNVHRLRDVPAGRRIVVNVRSPDFVPLVILTDANVNLLAFKRGVPGEFSTDVDYVATYTGTYYVSVGPLLDLVTGRYLISTRCESAQCPPSITTQPKDATIRMGERARLSVAATGSEPMQYLWRDMTDPLSATNGLPEFTTPPLFRSTRFQVSLINYCGSVDSREAIVRVEIPKRRSSKHP